MAERVMVSWQRGIEGKKVSDQVVRYVMTVTDEEFADLSAGILASAFKIERSKLSRQFKHQTGITLEDFLFKERMTRAAFLLKAHGDITVKEVSRRIGYCNSDYFIRRFRGYYGIVPGKYKEFKSRQPSL